MHVSIVFLWPLCLCPTVVVRIWGWQTTAISLRRLPKSNCTVGQLWKDEKQHWTFLNDVWMTVGHVNCRSHFRIVSEAILLGTGGGVQAYQAQANIQPRKHSTIDKRRIHHQDARQSTASICKSHVFEPSSLSSLAWFQARCKGRARPAIPKV